MDVAMACTIQLLILMLNTLRSFFWDRGLSLSFDLAASVSFCNELAAARVASLSQCCCLRGSVGQSVVPCFDVRIVLVRQRRRYT